MAREYPNKKNNTVKTNKTGLFRWKKAERIIFVLAYIGLAVLAMHVFFGPIGSEDKPAQKEADARIGELNSDIVGAKPKVTSLSQLLALPEKKLADVDVASMNLLCAEGLPGSEILNVNKCLKMLDSWARRVKTETDRYLYKFSQNPHEYKNSEGYFRMMMLVTVLQQDYGVHYNLERVRDIDFTNSKDQFIHGMINDENGGTCVSMPVLYVAVGKRLNYPLKLVLTKEHIFARWESKDGSERFNIEGSGRGFESYDDDYYKTWPLQMTPQEIASGRYLKSLTPAEELATFLACRGHCLLDIGRTAEAQMAYGYAHRLAPKDPALLAWMDQATQQMTDRGDSSGRGRIGGREGQGASSRDPLAELERIRKINEENRRRIYGNATVQPPMPQTPRPTSPSPYQPRPPEPYNAQRNQNR